MKRISIARVLSWVAVSTLMVSGTALAIRPSPAGVGVVYEVDGGALVIVY